MLNIDIIRFEAQDVITASTAAPEEPTVDPCADGHNLDVKVENGQFNASCTVCGKSYVGPGPITEDVLK